MRVTTHVTGPAPVTLAWERYADPTLWSAWAPQIRSVETDGPGPQRIHVGMRGTVHALLGVSVRFKVTEVDEARRRWAWLVRLPLLTLRLEHTVEPWRASGTRTGLVVEGPAPVVLAYVPVARLALHRLVAAQV